MKFFVKPFYLFLAALALAFAPQMAEAGTPHTAQQNAPIQLGTSGSTQSYLTVGGNSYCYAGTLGSAVIDASFNTYILSNNHVLALQNKASLGEPIIHVGSLDNGCSNSGSSLITVGQLSDFVPIEFCKPFRGTLMRCARNTVDAAIAAVADNAVRSDGAILEIGPLAATPAVATVGMAVQKSGRTTGLTTGTVVAVDVDVLVCYEEPCDVPKNLARFVSQVRVDGNFSAGGDSGSVIADCADDGASGCLSNPAPVGLLFAGGESTTFFNTFENVQSALAIAPLGCDASCFVSGGDGGGTGGNGGKKEKPPGKNKSASSTGFERAAQVRAAHADNMLRLNGVQGTGVGRDSAGAPVIEIYLQNARSAADGHIPADLDGIPVRVVITGQIRAF